MTEGPSGPKPPLALDEIRRLLAGYQEALEKIDIGGPPIPAEDAHSQPPAPQAQAPQASQEAPSAAGARSRAEPLAFQDIGGPGPGCPSGEALAAGVEADSATGPQESGACALGAGARWLGRLAAFFSGRARTADRGQGVPASSGLGREAVNRKLDLLLERMLDCEEAQLTLETRQKDVEAQFLRIKELTQEMIRSLGAGTRRGGLSE